MAVQIDQFSMNFWAWGRSENFRLGFSLQGFRVSCFILSEFLTKDILECIVNPTYLIGCCDCTLINLVFSTIALIFNATHKMGCYEYWYWLGWYNFCVIICLFLLFYFLCFAFGIYIMWFLRSNKSRLSERFFLLSRYEF